MSPPSRYFTSRACARELFRAERQDKSIFAVLEPENDLAKGGLEQQACLQILLHDRYPPQHDSSAPPTLTWTQKWALDGEVENWGKEWSPNSSEQLHVPTVQEMATALFKGAMLEWNRLSIFQDVSMRLIAERILTVCSPPTEGGASMDADHGVAKSFTFTYGEVSQKPIRLAPFAMGRRFDLYISTHNLGARSLGEGLDAFVRQRVAPGSRRKGVLVTQDMHALEACEHMVSASSSRAAPRTPARLASHTCRCAPLPSQLLYLTSATWTRGDASATLAHEVCKA